MPEFLTEIYRGIPTGTSTPLEDVSSLGLEPASGNMPLPALTLDEEKFRANVKLMLDYCSSNGLLIAPHAKTPMAPGLAKQIIAAGAWGVSVANIQQAAVMLSHGIRRLILANEVGGRKSGERLGALLARYPDAECLAFADSPACIDALAAASAVSNKPMSVLLELGAGRAGIRNLASLQALASYAQQRADSIAIKGIAAYEGSAEAATEKLKTDKIRELLKLAMHGARFVKQELGLDEVIVSAGGSSYFDLVCDAAAQAELPGLVTILRSGAIFFFDHGTYEQSFQRLRNRADGLTRESTLSNTKFSPALRVWAEILSNPEPGLYICGMGKRDVSHDIDLPRPLAFYRDGRTLGVDPTHTGFSITQLNDQHAFLHASSQAPELRPGDVVEFGISHPCTCIDKWRLILGIREGRVASAYKTYFG